MKKKPIMIATTLIALLVLTPIVHAGVVHFWWDNVYFVEGTDIDYPHPDNIYYDISPSSDWTKVGTHLAHHQLNRDTSYAIVIGTAIVVEIILLILLRRLPNTAIAYYVGGLASIVLASFIGVLLDEFFVDERGCMWWWIGSVFMAYLEDNLNYLFSLPPDIASALITINFLCYGYFRIGKVTFHDPLGIGDPSPPPTLSISSTLWGRTDPYAGTYTYCYGSSVNVEAIPWEDCVFDYWILDGTAVYSNPITVTMNSDHSLKAYFHSTNPGGGDGCPTLYSWNGHGYVDYGVIDIHDPSGEDMVKEVSIAKQDLAVEDRKAKLRLEEGWLGLNYSESVIDQVKLYAIDEDGKLKLCPLTTAVHSRLGNVREYLVASDDVKAQTLLLETIDLTFKVREDSQDFIFVIEGCNQLKQ